MSITETGPGEIRWKIKTVKQAVERKKLLRDGTLNLFAICQHATRGQQRCPVTAKWAGRVLRRKRQSNKEQEEAS